MLKEKGSLPEAFIASYDEYGDAIFRHCYFRVFDRERGLELMQETFMKTWEYLADGKRIKNVQAFLYKIANNLIIDEVRRKKRRTEDSLEHMQEKEGFDIEGENGNAFSINIEQQVLLNTMKKIEEPYRSAVLLRYVDGLQPKEIAKLLGESVNVVSVRTNRGMNKLRSLLKQHG